ncbi:hypothetical protein FACS189461_4690 [Spirochaetia bacterium]|nr:hypothetical protein FACS189461_4690 [Spirochaetia bacterium]
MLMMNIPDVRTAAGMDSFSVPAVKLAVSITVQIITLARGAVIAANYNQPKVLMFQAAVFKQED